MSRLEKRFRKIQNNPKDVSFDELRTVLEGYGFQLRNVTGSHHIFKGQVGDIKEKISIPRRNPVKIPYVKMAIELIERVIEESE